MQPRLGKVQYQIMQTLWRLNGATARQITDELGKTQFIAHSTVQTLLRQMEAKGVVAHDVEERTFVFRALLQASELPETPLHDLLTRLFHGSVVNLMSHLLKHETISREELAQLRQMIEDTREDTAGQCNRLGCVHCEDCHHARLGRSAPAAVADELPERV